MKFVNDRSGRCFAVIKTKKKKMLRKELSNEAIFPEYEVVEKPDAFWICLDSYNGNVDDRIDEAKDNLKKYLSDVQNTIDLKAIFVHDNFV